MRGQEVFFLVIYSLHQGMTMRQFIGQEGDFELPISIEKGKINLDLLLFSEDKGLQQETFTLKFSYKHQKKTLYLPFAENQEGNLLELGWFSARAAA